MDRVRCAVTTSSASRDRQALWRDRRARRRRPRRARGRGARAHRRERRGEEHAHERARRRGASRSRRRWRSIGERYAPRLPLDARGRGVALIHQELSLCPHLTVAENILLGARGRRAAAGSTRAGTRARALALLDELPHPEIHPDRKRRRRSRSPRGRSSRSAARSRPMRASC